MDPSNAVRQVNELESILTLKDELYKEAIEIKTPTLFSRLQRISASINVHSSSTQQRQLEVKKCITFQINFASIYPDELSNLILALEFPLDYPSESPCNVRAIRRDSLSSDVPIEYKSCTIAIQQYLEAFCGFECVELVIDWISDNKDTCLKEQPSSSSTQSQDSSRKGRSQCFILRYNHLLSGPEHKKEKAMIDTAKKSKLQGGLLWGTPGIVVIVPPSTEDDAKAYGSDCRTIGKRPDGVGEEMWLPDSGIENAGLGGLAQQKRGGRLQELDTAGLRIACGGDEDLLRAVLGVC